MNEPIMIRQLGDASAADITDDAVAVVSVEDEAAATGYTTKKSLLRRIKDYIIGNTSITGSGKSDVTSLLGGTSIAGVSDGTVTGAIADNAALVGDTSISGVGDGTVTGAISSLNSDLVNKPTVTEVTSQITCPVGTLTNTGAYIHGRICTITATIALTSAVSSGTKILENLPAPYGINAAALLIANNNTGVYINGNVSRTAATLTGGGVWAYGAASSGTSIRFSVSYILHPLVVVS